MKVFLTRHLHIGKDHYPKGIQDISDVVLKSNKHFAKHIKAGHILDAAVAPKQVRQPTNKERATALLEKVLAKPKAPSVVKEPEAPVAPVVVSDPVDADDGKESQEEVIVEDGEQDLPSDDNDEAPAAPVKTTRKSKK